MELARFIQNNRAAILGLSVLLALAGLRAAAEMPVAIFPEVAFHRISIIARAGELPVEQSSTALTQPLENAVAGIVGVETIRSTTTRGAAQLDLVFAWNADMYRALQLVHGALEEARGSLPEGTTIEARLLDISAFPVIGLALSSRQSSAAELSDFAIYDLAPRLRTIPGVYRVDLSGAKIREYSLTVDPEALVAHRLDLSTVEQAVREANGVGAGGLLRDGHLLTMIEVRGQGTAVDSLLDIDVAVDGAAPVPLRAIATLEESVREDYTRAAADGGPAVLLTLSRQPSGNALAISAAVRRRLKESERRHPDQRFAVFYDEADLVRAAVDGVRDAIGIGLILAVGVVFFFLTDWWTTAVAALIVPMTLLIACLVFHALGMTFNLMTLGGIAACIGLVLDDAIVVVENLHRHRLAGETRLAAASSMDAIGSALVGSTLTTVAVLVPLAFLGGVAGAFFRPLAVTMWVTLLVSLALSLTFTPVLATDVMDPMRRHRPFGDRFAATLAHAYPRVLRRTLRQPVVVLAVALLVCVGAVLVERRMRTGFVPVMDEGAFVLDYWSPPGTSLAETEALLDAVDTVLRAVPEVQTFARRTGTEMGFFLTETNRGDYSVRLRGGARRPITDIIDELRTRIRAHVPGLRVEFVQVLQDVIGDLSGNPSPIEVRVAGGDPAARMETAKNVSARLAALPGVVDTFDGITPIGATRRIDIDDQRTRRVGLSAETIRGWVETATTGTLVGQVLEGDRAIPLRLRFPDRYRTGPQALSGLTLVTPTSALAPLTAVAQIGPAADAILQARENLRPVVRVTAHIEGRDLGSVIRDLHASLAGLNMPPGVTTEIGGLYVSQQAAFAQLLVVFGAAVAAVTAVLLVALGSAAAAFAVIGASVLAPSGSLLALWLSGTALNVSSIVGMIMVVGIVAKNGILLLDFALRAHARGGNLYDSLIEAGRVRLRPILMTALAAMAGLLPLAFGSGAGTQMQRPLAIAIIGGISVSAFFSLLFVPVLYAVVTRSRRPADASLRAHAGD